jgi:hypothetical protein
LLDDLDTVARPQEEGIRITDCITAMLKLPPDDPEVPKL